MSAQPYYEAILEVNSLYDEGHAIIIDTARGSTSRIDWYQKTKDQLNDWGVKYHQLFVGKNKCQHFC